jgi:uncharacterized membrane protein YcaP (DUF421 family)
METVLRAAAIYVALLLIIRFSGRRTLGEMSSFEFVLLLIISETTQQAMLGDDFSVSNAILLIVTLFALDIGLSYAQRWSKTLAVWIEGQPTVLISLGVPDERALARSRVGLEQVLEAARLQFGLERLEQVRFAVLEASGKISIVPQPGGSGGE